MTFLHPYILLALLLPLLLAAGIIISRRLAGNAWRQLVSPAHPELVKQRPKWRTALPAALALLSLTGIIIAAARPINGYGQSEATASGRNLLIALDISRSMETQDVAPSRLEEARAAAYELIDALPGDKIGLIVFAGEADVVVPLTYDHTALRDALEQVNRSWAGYGGTNFGMLLRTAMQNFARSAPEGANALVILSDGEDTVDSSLQMAEEARKNKLLVITVGIGTPAGGAIPDPHGENGLWQDAAGKHVISKLDVNSLRRFAESTGGDFFTMGSGADLAAFAREAADKLERHEESYAAGRTPLDLFMWFALPALLALLATIIIGSEWKAPRHTSLLLLLAFAMSLPAQADTPAEAYEQGLHALQAGNANAAGEKFSEALLSEQEPLQAAVHHALGNMRTRATLDKLRLLYGSSEDAPPTAAPPAAPTPEALQGIIDELQKGLTPYRDALAADATLAASQKNIEKIEELIKKIEEEIERLKQQQQQQNQNQQQDQQNQEKQQQDQNQQQQNQDQQQNQQQDQKKQDQQQDQQQKQDEQQQNESEQSGSPEQNKPQDEAPQNPQNNPADDQQGQDQQGQDQQQDQKEQEDQQGQDPQPQEQGEQQAEQPRQQPAPEAELSEEEKNKQRAAGILRMHLDEEKGSPIPHFNRAVRPPSKDY